MTVLASLVGLCQLYRDDVSIPYLSPSPPVVNSVAPGLSKNVAVPSLAKEGSAVVLSPIDLRPPELIAADAQAAAAATAAAATVTASSASSASAASTVAAAASTGSTLASDSGADGRRDERSASNATAHTQESSSARSASGAGSSADDHLASSPSAPSPSEVAATLLSTTTQTEPDEQPRPGRQPRWSETPLPADTRPVLEPGVVPFVVVRDQGLPRGSRARARPWLTPVPRCAPHFSNR